MQKFLLKMLKEPFRPNCKSSQFSGNGEKISGNVSGITMVLIVVIYRVNHADLYCSFYTLDKIPASTAEAGIGHYKAIGYSMDS